MLIGLKKVGFVFPVYVSWQTTWPLSNRLVGIHQKKGISVCLQHVKLKGYLAVFKRSHPLRARHVKYRSTAVELHAPIRFKELHFIYLEVLA